MAEYIDRPGIDQAEIIDSGRVYPVVMTIPIGSGDVTGTVGGASVPGFDIPTYDTIVITEDANGKTTQVEYQKDGSPVTTLNFTYSDHTPVAPLSTTTIVKS